MMRIYGAPLIAKPEVTCKGDSQNSIWDSPRLAWVLSQGELTPSSHRPGHCLLRFSEWSTRMLSFGSAEERCIHRNGHLSKDGMARPSDSGHLTGRNRVGGRVELMSLI